MSTCFYTLNTDCLFSSFVKSLRISLPPNLHSSHQATYTHLSSHTFQLRTRPRIIQPLNPLPRLPHHSFLRLSSRLTFTISRRSNRKIQSTTQLNLWNGIRSWVWWRIRRCDETTCFPQDGDTCRYVPFPASAFPPDIECSRCDVC